MDEGIPLGVYKHDSGNLYRVTNNAKYGNEDVVVCVRVSSLSVKDSMSGVFVFDRNMFLEETTFLSDGT